MNNVYVVFYDSLWVTKNCGVFSNVENANEFIETHAVENDYDLDYYTVEQWEVK